MLRTLFLIVALVCSLSAASAKDAAFDTFWSDFKSALTKNDKEAISSLTSLPFESYDGKLNKTQFIKYCDKLFSKKTRACLVKQKPVADKNSYSAFCGEEIFVFEKVKGKYLFTNITPND
ncbi:MAG: hypothetical protein Q8T09_14950 [Candidatus Melainabacteria bacterium]|nr:hypothetical protein [Candidatus Melainabacteria bacterium]